MSNSFFDKYLSQVDESQKVELPVGGEFVQNGFVGPITMKMLWRIWTAVNVTGPEFRDEVPAPASYRQLRSGDYHFYWNRSADADLAIKLIGEDIRAEQYWVFSMPTAEVLNAGNLDALKEGFGPEVVYMSNVKTYRSRKRRHEFHLITLPSVVAATATAMGIDNAGFDLSEISVTSIDANDAWSREYVGDPDNGEGFETSVLGKRRKELWASLGEDDMMRYTLDDKRNSKLNVTSEKMKQCMRMVYYPPKTPIYGRLMNVLDPQIGAERQTESGDYRRFQIASVSEFYVDADEARKVADKELAERGQERGSVTVSDGAGGKKSTAGGPPVPEAWKDMPDDWVGVIMEYVGKPDMKLAKDLKEKPNMFACTEEEALAWKAHLEK